MADVELTKEQDDKLQVVLNCIKAADQEIFKGQLNKQAFEVMGKVMIQDLLNSKGLKGIFSYANGKLVEQKKPDEEANIPAEESPEDAA